jgi:hypothetical protein
LSKKLNTAAEFSENQRHTLTRKLRNVQTEGRLIREGQ